MVQYSEWISIRQQLSLLHLLNINLQKNTCCFLSMPRLKVAHLGCQGKVSNAEVDCDSMSTTFFSLRSKGVLMPRQHSITPCQRPEASVLYLGLENGGTSKILPKAIGDLRTMCLACIAMSTLTDSFVWPICKTNNFRVFEGEKKAGSALYLSACKWLHSVGLLFHRSLTAIIYTSRQRSSFVGLVKSCEAPATPNIILSSKKGIHEDRPEVYFATRRALCHMLTFRTM